VALAKVRALHPDFFSDEDVAEVSIPARLLFAGLWCFACDNGHLADKPKQIKRWVYATDDVNAAELLRELEVAGLIKRAENWISIPGLMKRQRIDYRYFKTCDRDDCNKPQKPDSQRETPRAPAEPPQSHAVTTRGPATDGDGDGDGDVTTTPAAADEFDEFWTIYPRKEGKGAARKAWVKAVKSLPASELLPIVRSYSVRVHGTERRFIPFPATWLNQERWADEVSDQQGEANSDAGWFQPFTMPPAPPEVEDDPEAYEAWAEGRRAAWRAGERW
jgi:hypothetical protein